MFGPKLPSNSLRHFCMATSTSSGSTNKPAISLSHLSHYLIYLTISFISLSHLYSLWSGELSHECYIITSLLQIFASVPNFFALDKFVSNYWVSTLLNYHPIKITSGCIATEKLESKYVDLKSNSHYRNFFYFLWVTSPPQICLTWHRFNLYLNLFWLSTVSI